MNDATNGAMNDPANTPTKGAAGNTTNDEELVRSSLSALAESAGPPPADLAERVLHARRRRRRRQGVSALAAAAVAAVCALTAGPPLDLLGGKDAHQPARPAPKLAVTAHPGQSPPKEAVAAGRSELTAYWKQRTKRLANGDRLQDRTWWLLNPVNGRYEKTGWAYVDVAPGMRTAAVLAGPLPATRVGLLDLHTGKVRRWIALDHKAGSVQWSPDGRRLLVTTYDRNPMLALHRNRHVNPDGGSAAPEPSRTGFALIDPSTGTADFHALPSRHGKDFGGRKDSRQDLSWSGDGRYVYDDAFPRRHPAYYDLDGKRRRPYGRGGSALDGEAVTHPLPGPSPDGKLLADEDSVVTRNGRVVLNDGMRLVFVAWADDGRLIAWGCSQRRHCVPGVTNSPLVAVDLKGRRVAKLTGTIPDPGEGATTQAEQEKPWWRPEFTPRS